MTSMTPQERVLHVLQGVGATLATAESLTGGLLAARLVDVPGASAVFRGGIVAYATDLKYELLGVDRGQLSRTGPVTADVAIAMARGAAERLTADWGLATTGVAGPTPQGEAAVGTVFVAVFGPSTALTRMVSLGQERTQIREGAVRGALDLCLYALGEQGLLP
jgi:nicotinamide-nucleotide amidase